MASCCETCPLASTFMVEPGWSCQLHLVEEIESKCERRIYLEQQAAKRGTTLEVMLAKATN